ncbi:MAG: ribosome-binding factor [Actinomycetota bacterium]|jgi:ribosome-binding factor A|nr:ribosome-binding factor [Actinomycetota bacterium]
MSQRTEKIQKLARQVLGELIGELKDPRIGFATVTTVRVTPDLKHARVWVSVMGSEDEQQETMAGLASATPRLRKELGHQMQLRYLPELVFELDRQIDEALRVEELLHKLHEKDES